MTQKSFQRKLTAILSADVEGYSRLMGLDEAATVRTLTAYREIMGSLIKQYRGRVVDSPGDNLLAEFASVVDAVQCAVEIQEELRARNVELSEQRKMAFRIGINLGDVIVEQERIYGDGVNIAARIEGLSEGGGICISGTVYEHVKNKLALGYEFLGEYQVKNITEPVRVYQVRMEPGVEESEIVSGQTTELELPDKPSIAVLPFVNMSQDPQQEYFSDGITEGIITSLSKVGELFVIARTSSFKYKGQAVDVQQVGRELGVGYVMEGSVQRSGERLRITAQLVDTKTGHHLWAERYDRDPKDIFAVQDEITMKIMTALQVKLTEGELGRFHAKGAKRLEAYEKYQQGLQYIRSFTLEGNILARQMFEEVIALDPEYAGGYALLGWTHVVDFWFGWSESPQTSIEQVFNMAQKVLDLEGSLAEGHNLLGKVYLFKRQYDRAIAEAERSVALEPNNAYNIHQLAENLIYAGRSEEAIALYNKAFRLYPLPPSHFFQSLAAAYLLTEQYDQAIANCRKAIQRSPDSLFAHIVLAAAYGSSGHDEEARAEATEVLRINPKFSLEYLAQTWPFKNKVDMKRYVEPLRKAGLK
jgi:adenylate cyclase